MGVFLRLPLFCLDTEDDLEVPEKISNRQQLETQILKVELSFGSLYE